MIALSKALSFYHLQSILSIIKQNIIHAGIFLVNYVII